MVKQIAEDLYRLYGMEHFCSKYGLTTPEGLEDFEKEYSVELAENEINDTVVTWVKTEFGRIPFFEESLGAYPIEKKGKNVKVNFDIFGVVGHILFGHLEGLSQIEKEEFVGVPFVDIYERLLFDALSETNNKFVMKPFWPDGKKFTVCLTHDVDEVRKTYQYATRSLRNFKRGEFSKAKKQIKSFVSDKRLGNNPYWTFNRLMEIEENLGVRSTFYFLQEDSEVKLSKPETWRHHGRRYRFDDVEVTKTINKLNSGGWEIGLHGSFHSYNNPKKLQMEKDELERVLGAEVCGIRQHNLNLKIPETWRHHEEIGLEYDTTLGFNDYVGFRYGTSFPFHPLDSSTKKTLSILEIPLVIEDIALFRYDNPWKECVDIINSIESLGGVLTLLWHHSVFNEREYPGWTEMYQKIIGFCKERNAWITTANELNKWWRSR